MKNIFLEKYKDDFNLSKIKNYVLFFSGDIHTDDDWALRRAAKYGNLEVVKYLVEQGADVNAAYGNALSSSAKNGHLEVVKYLVENGADVGEDDDALLSAADGGHLEIINYLIEKGAKNEYVLSKSVKKCHLKVVKYFVENGYKVNNRDIKASIKNNCLEILKYFVENDVDVNADEALLSAADGGHLEIIKYLIEKGAKNEYVLTTSIEKCNLEVVKYFVENGYKVNNRDIKTTIKNNCLEILKYFVEKGAKIDFNNYESVDIEQEENDEDMSPLSLAVKYASESRSYQRDLIMYLYDSLNMRVNIVKFLIEKGCDIHSNDEYPLRKAAIMGDIEIVKLLVENGADVHALHGALDNAAKHGHLELVIYLVQNGADIHADNNAALLKSVGNGYLEVVKYLVENGANIHVDNENALRTSILENDSDMINYLLKNGAIVNEDIIKIAKSQPKYISNLFKKYTSNTIIKNINSTCDSSNLSIEQLKLINKNFNSVFTKDDICERLSELFKEKEKYKQIMLPKCKNDTTVLLTDIKDVPGIFFYNTKIHDKLFCGDIRELQNIDKKNPWTNEDFTDELKIIRDEISKYELIIENLDETEIEEMKTNLDEKMDTTIRKSMLKVLTKLRYPKDVDYYVNSNELQMNNFLSSLKAEHVISENDFNNINTSDLNGKKLALANLLQMKIEYDTSIVVINGSNISSLLVVLEEEYNKAF